VATAIGTLLDLADALIRLQSYDGKDATYAILAGYIEYYDFLSEMKGMRASVGQDRLRLARLDYAERFHPRILTPMYGVEFSPAVFQSEPRRDRPIRGF
jgi:hypothetical protein